MSKLNQNTEDYQDAVLGNNLEIDRELIAKQKALESELEILGAKIPMPKFNIEPPLGFTRLHIYKSNQ